MAINLDTLLIQTIIQIVVSIIFVAPAFWASGRLLAGKDKAKFTDAIWIAVLGSLINGVITAFAGGIIAMVLTLIIWLGLIKHFFDCGWLKSIAIAIVAVIISAIVLTILAFIFGAALFGMIGSFAI